MRAKITLPIIVLLVATGTVLGYFFGAAPANALAPEQTEPVVGPARGSLVIVGGNLQDDTIRKRFLQLAGGADQPIVVIPTAAGAEHYSPSWPPLVALKEAGAQDVTLLHTNDREVADSGEFVAPIERARGVWFSGGRQWRLADSYLGTRTQRALEELLERDGVIGGSSAGATIQGSYLARGDTKTNTVMMGDHEQGFAFLENVAIDQHLLRRNRHFDLLEIVRARPELLGIGIDEDTAIVVRGDRFEVMGRGYVAIYDLKSRVDDAPAPGGDFYFLSPGDTFDLATRKAFRPNRQPEPLERIVPIN